MENRNLLVDIKDGVALVTINRPKVLNALHTSVIAELQATFESLNDDPAVKAIVVTGSGEKAFVAGADIAEMADYSSEQALAFARTGQRLVNFIGSMPKPVIAAVNGFALGGGMELALACDFIYASENARMGLPEVTLGIMPGFGGSQKFGRLLGRNRANELVFTGRMLSAAEAKEWGIVNAVFPAGDLVGKALETAARIAGNGLLGVARAKDAIRRGLDMGEGDGMDYEAALFAVLFATADQKEGMRAFLEKRKAHFSGS
ncbi:MAG TPA: enoyl-CoA hydratase-related protein [Geobacteraceae bacterium]